MIILLVAFSTIKIGLDSPIKKSPIETESIEILEEKYSISICAPAKLSISRP